MALDDKYDPFTYHSVIHMSPQTQTEGVSGTSQSYLSFRASQNSLLFKLDAPFWVARSTAVSSQSFSRNRALHLIKDPSSLHSLLFFTWSISCCTTPAKCVFHCRLACACFLREKPRYCDYCLKEVS